jgi:hypothetical protein
MGGFKQEGKFITRILSEDVTDAMGKAVVFATDDQEVRLMQDGDTDFVGVIYAVTNARSMYEGFPNNVLGTVDALEGTEVTIMTEGVYDGLTADGAIGYGDPFGPGDDGKFAVLDELDGTPTAADIMMYCGRSFESEVTDASKFEGYIRGLQ